MSGIARTGTCPRARKRRQLKHARFGLEHAETEPERVALVALLREEQTVRLEVALDVLASREPRRIRREPRQLLGDLLGFGRVDAEGMHHLDEALMHLL